MNQLLCGSFRSTDVQIQSSGGEHVYTCTLVQIQTSGGEQVYTCTLVLTTHGVADTACPLRIRRDLGHACRVSEISSLDPRPRQTFPTSAQTLRLPPLGRRANAHETQMVLALSQPLVLVITCASYAVARTCC